MAARRGAPAPARQSRADRLPAWRSVRPLQGSLDARSAAATDHRASAALLNGSLSDLDVRHLQGRLGNRLAGVPQPFEMKLDRLPDQVCDLFGRLPYRNTTRKIGHIGP